MRGTKKPQDMRRPAGGEQFGRKALYVVRPYVCSRCRRPCALLQDDTGALLSSCCTALATRQQG